MLPLKHWITLLALSMALDPCAAAAETQNGATIQAYQKNSFAPSRGETFLLQVMLSDPGAIRSGRIELRSGDDDLVKTLPLQQINAGQELYEIRWDGKDEAGETVPDEAYFPVLYVTSAKGETVAYDARTDSGGEEVFEFEKNIRPGRIEYDLPVASRVLIRSGIKNGPMLRTVIDWEPRTAGFHAERWDGMDTDRAIAIEQDPQASYLIMGYQLPNHGIITYANETESYREYRERKKLSVPKRSDAEKLIERNGKTVRPEFYNPLLKQKSPRIEVLMLDRESREKISEVNGFDEIITEVKLHPQDEIYLDQERYEISFFIDKEFVAEEEQGFVPFTWRWAPGRHGLKPGKHVLTVNVSGYSGQVGVKNTAFTLSE